MQPQGLGQGNQPSQKDIIIAQLTDAIRQLEFRQPILEKALADTQEAIGHFQGFINSPGLGTVDKLAAGMLCFARSQTHGINTELTTIRENLAKYRAALENANSTIVKASLIPPAPAFRGKN